MRTEINRNIPICKGQEKYYLRACYNNTKIMTSYNKTMKNKQTFWLITIKHFEASQVIL